MSYKKITFVQKQPLHLWVWNFWVVAECRNYILPHQFVSAVCNAKNIYSDNFKISEDDTLKQINWNISIFRPVQYDFKQKKQFEQKYKHTFVSTAVMPWTKSAKDQSLHEIEYISHLDEKSEFLKWVWYIKSDFIVDWKRLFEIIKKWDQIYLWWEFKYGFWLCEIVDKCDSTESKNNIYKLTEVNNDKEFLDVFPLTMRLTDSVDSVWQEFKYCWIYWVSES